MYDCAPRRTSSRVRATVPFPRARPAVTRQFAVPDALKPKLPAKRSTAPGRYPDVGTPDPIPRDTSTNFREPEGSALPVSGYYALMATPPHPFTSRVAVISQPMAHNSNSDGRCRRWRKAPHARNSASAEQRPAWGQVVPSADARRREKSKRSAVALPRPRGSQMHGRGRSVPVQRPARGEGSHGRMRGSSHSREHRGGSPYVSDEWMSARGQPLGDDDRPSSEDAYLPTSSVVFHVASDSFSQDEDGMVRRSTPSPSQSNTVLSDLSSHDGPPRLPSSSDTFSERGAETFSLQCPSRWAPSLAHLSSLNNGLTDSCWNDDVSVPIGTSFHLRELSPPSASPSSSQEDLRGLSSPIEDGLRRWSPTPGYDRMPPAHTVQHASTAVPTELRTGSPASPSARSPTAVSAVPPPTTAAASDRRASLDQKGGDASNSAASAAGSARGNGNGEQAESASGNTRRREQLRALRREQERLQERLRQLRAHDGASVEEAPAGSGGGSNGPDGNDEIVASTLRSRGAISCARSEDASEGSVQYPRHYGARRTTDAARELVQALAQEAAATMVQKT